MKRDAERKLPSHLVALRTIEGAEALVRGDYPSAIQLLHRSRAHRFYGRSEGAVALLEAEALRRAGEEARADSLYDMVRTPGRMHDDGDVWLSLRPVAVANLGVRRGRGRAAN